MLGRSKDPGSANKAKDRLQFVLIHDRVNIPPERLQMMKDEIVAVISKYVAVTHDQVEIALSQRERNQNRLIAEVPFASLINALDPDEDVPYPITSTLLVELQPETSGDKDKALPQLNEHSSSEETRPTRSQASSSDDSLLEPNNDLF
ncbi:MAG: cell division topological specificity factor MinE [Chitinophagaceae bacterium]|nr:cell division topological specificity factor MinE [Anaerolineae bacterium]